MKELTFLELEGQQAELLPSRETLYFGTDYSFNLAAIDATNTSVALNAASLWSNAHSTALQGITVVQQ